MELLQRGSHLASLLHLDMSFTHGLANMTEKDRKMAYMRGMWNNLGPILCGPDPNQQPKKAIDHMYDARCVTSSCKTRALRFMLYILTRGPKILYSSNGTMADLIIKKVRYRVRVNLYLNRAALSVILKIQNHCYQ